MRKLNAFFIINIIFTLSFGSLRAQITMERSNVFNEPPSEGWTKILQLKNGNTLYFHYGRKRGIDVITFNSKRQKISEKRIESDAWNHKRRGRVRVRGLFEINSEPVLFIQFYADKRRTLYRLRIDPNTGALIKEENIGEILSVPLFAFLNSEYDIKPEIHIEKEEYSGNYMVIYTGLSDRINGSSGIRIELFDSTHRKYRDTYLSGPQSDLKYLSLIGSVASEKGVFLVTWGANSTRGEDGNIFISRLQSADTSFTTRVLRFTDEFKQSRADLHFDNGRNQLIMLSNTLDDEKRKGTYYMSYLSFIDPESLELKTVKPVGNEKINEYGINVLKTDLNFKGIPQKLAVNADNTLTVLKESVTVVSVISGRTGATIEQHAALGNIGIDHLSAEGTPIHGYAMMKNQQYGEIVGSLYMKNREKGVWEVPTGGAKYLNDDPFMSYEYIHGDKADYVIFNDHPKNDGKEEKTKKRKYADDADYMNTICYTLRGGVATRSYLFGEPQGRRNTRACYIDGSYYDKATHTYVTVVSTQHGSRYKSQIAWIHFE